MRSKDRLTPLKKVVDPSADLLARRARDLGVRGIDDTQRIERIERRLHDEQSGFFSVTSPVYYRDGITGTNAYTPRLVLPSSGTVFASALEPDLLMPEHGAIIYVHLFVNVPLTSGRLGFGFRVNGLAVPLDAPQDSFIESALPAPFNQRASYYSHSLDRGLPFSQGDLVSFRFSSSGMSQTVIASGFFTYAFPAL